MPDSFGRRGVGAAALMLCLVVASAAFAQTPSKLLHYPQLILHNGKVLTVDEQFTISEAVAVRDGKFLEVGTNADVLALKGPETHVIDLKGRSVVPGFIDTHLHSWRGNISKRGVKTLEFETLEDG